MKLRVDIVTSDESGKEISRKTVGEYGTEVEAIIAIQEQEKNLGETGKGNSRLEMIQTLESPKERRLDC